MATNRSLAAVGLLVVGLALLLPLVATGLGGGWWGMGGHTGPMAGPMGGGGYGGMGWGGGLVGWSLGLLGLLAVGGAVLLFRDADSAGDPALSELRSAYARGDLTDEEFERRRSRLEGTDAGEE